MCERARATIPLILFRETLSLLYLCSPLTNQRIINAFYSLSCNSWAPRLCFCDLFGSRVVPVYSWNAGVRASTGLLYCSSQMPTHAPVCARWAFVLCRGDGLELKTKREAGLATVHQVTLTATALNSCSANTCLGHCPNRWEKGGEQYTLRYFSVFFCYACVTVWFSASDLAHLDFISESLLTLIPEFVFVFYIAKSVPVGPWDFLIQQSDPGISCKTTLLWISER